MAYNRFAAVDEAFKFPPEVRAALATDAVLRNVVVPMTQTQRNNLTGADLWDGRLVENTTTDRVNRYDAGTDSWKVLAETADLDSGLVTVEDELDDLTDVVDTHETRLDAAELNNARIMTASAGLQQNVNARWMFDTGFPAPRRLSPVFAFSRNYSGTMECGDMRATAYETTNGVVYVTGSGLSLGLDFMITRVD